MKILIANDYLNDLFEHAKRELTEHEVVRCADKDLIQNVKDIDVLIPVRTPTGAEIMDAAPKLRLIQQYAVGFDNIDLDAARERKIPVARVPSPESGMGKSLAEGALFLMIGAGRRFTQLQKNIASQSLEIPTGHTLFGKTVLIVGLGSAGQALARLLKPFDCHVYGIKRTLSNSLSTELGLSKLASPENLISLLPDCDFVVITVPLTPETAGLLGSREIEAMKQGACVVNVARGGVIEEQPFKQALRSGKIAAAGLDVFWNEPPDPEDDLFDLEVISMPHATGTTDLFLGKAAKMVADNVRRMEIGEEILHRVD